MTADWLPDELQDPLRRSAAVHIALVVLLAFMRFPAPEMEPIEVVLEPLPPDLAGEAAQPEPAPRAAPEAVPGPGGPVARQPEGGASSDIPRGALYTVRAGDSVSAIARRAGVSVDALVRHNPCDLGSNPGLVIYPGDRLMVPAAGARAPGPCPRSPRMVAEAPRPEPTPEPAPRPAPVPEPEPAPVEEPDPEPAPALPSPPLPAVATEPEPEPEVVPEPAPAPAPEPLPEPEPEPDPCTLDHDEYVATCWPRDRGRERTLVTRVAGVDMTGGEDWYSPPTSTTHGVVKVGFGGSPLRIPKRLQDEGWSGRVSVVIDVPFDSAGQPGEPRIVLSSGHEDLDARAKAWAARTAATPALVRHQPKATTVRLEFVLPGG